MPKDSDSYTVELLATNESKGTRTDIVSYLMSLYEEYSSSTYRQKKLEEVEDNWKRYRGERSTKSFPWEGCSNISMMLEAIVVDNIEPRLVAAVAGKGRDIIEVIPNTPDGVQYTQGVEKFAEWALAHNIEWQKCVPSWVHRVLIEGTGYIFPYYTEKVLKRGRRFVGHVPYDLITGERIQDEAVPSYAANGVPVEQRYVDEIRQEDVKVFRVVNDFAGIEDVYGPDVCEDWDETPTIRRQYVKYDDLVEQSIENGGVYDVSPELKQAARQRILESSDLDDAQGELNNPDIEILTFYLKYELEPGDRDWCIIAIAKDTETIIRKQYVRDVFYGLRGKPVKRLILFPDHGKQYGTGVPQKVRHLSQAINDCANQMIDSATVEINPWFFYGADAGLPDEIDISPGGANPVSGNPQSISFPKLGINYSANIEFINLITAYLERLIAVSSYQSGVEDIQMGQGAGTASGMKMILQEAQVRHSYMARPLKEQLADVIKLDMLLYAWYMPTDVDLVLPGGDVLRKVDVDALQQDYDFSIRISDSVYNQMMERAEAQELATIASAFPFANQMQLFKDLLDAYERKNPDAYIDQSFAFIVQAAQQNPEIVQVIQQYLQQKLSDLHQQDIQAVAADNDALSQARRQLQDQRMEADIARQAARQLAKRRIQDSMEMDAALQHKSMVTPKDIEDAKATVRRRLAQQIVEGGVL